MLQATSAAGRDACVTDRCDGWGFLGYPSRMVHFAMYISVALIRLYSIRSYNSMPGDGGGPALALAVLQKLRAHIESG